MKRLVLWKDEIHQKYNTRLIKTFSWENKNGTLLSDLQQKLEANGVVLSPLSPAQVWAEIVQNAEKDVTDFEMLLMTFLNLYKSNNCAMPELFKKANGLRKWFEKERATAFLKLFEPILLTYQESLAARKRIDFNDMINVAASHVAAGRFPKRVRYLIVDEFQDLSFGRYHLLKAIQEANPGCKLFCVGDDWQSIFRFAGSDISLFTRFEEYFGVTERSVIGNTYRFNQELIDLTTAFVQENPAQIKKKIYSQSAYRGKSVEVLKSFSSRPERDIKPIVKALEHIRDEVASSKLSPENVKVLVLARYNHDCKMLAEAADSFEVMKNAAGKTAITFLPYPHLPIEFMTMHRAKGLEADYVIVLNCNAGKYGIPSEQADDPLLNIVLSQADQFPNGEERRLFYVALTRTKRKVYLISSARNASRFVHELEPGIKKMYRVERDNVKR
jgi:DNA helicase-4